VKGADLSRTTKRAAFLWGNTPIKSFFGTIKVELVHLRCYRTWEGSAREGGTSRFTKYLLKSKL